MPTGARPRPRRAAVPLLQPDGWCATAALCLRRKESCTFSLPFSQNSPETQFQFLSAVQGLGVPREDAHPVGHEPCCRLLLTQTGRESISPSPKTQRGFVTAENLVKATYTDSFYQFNLQQRRQSSRAAPHWYIGSQIHAHAQGSLSEKSSLKLPHLTPLPRGSSHHPQIN